MFAVYENAVASMPSISPTVRVEFTDQSVREEGEEGEERDVRLC